MSKVFDEYAAIYDLFNKDKDYVGETDYVAELISRYRKEPAKSILTLGCGSGKHECLLSQKGFDVTGIDFSPGMIERAKINALGIPGNSVDFLVGDIRTFELEKAFDVIFALFHVMSYQNLTEDVIRVFNNVGKHGNPGALFLFDYWYGPGVLTDLPYKKKKEVIYEGKKYIRETTPVMHYHKNVVDVNFSFSIENPDNSKGKTAGFSETHSMRYFFRPELESIALHTGFESVVHLKWLTQEELNRPIWYGISVFRKLN